MNLIHDYNAQMHTVRSGSKAQENENAAGNIRKKDRNAAKAALTCPYKQADD
jgi:hypothetical protein